MRRMTFLTNSIILTLGAIFSVVSFSRAQIVHNLKGARIDDVSCLTVYFMPLRSATFAPVNEEKLKHTGSKIILCTPKDVGILQDAIRFSSSSTILHKERSPKIDHGNIRMRIESEKGEHLVFVDTDGVVNNAGKQYQLTPVAMHNLELCEISWQARQKSVR